MIEQAGRLTLTSRAFRNDQLPLFYEELCALTRSHKVLPMNSGAEAVESAIKAVRKWGYEVKGVPEGQAEIIVCANNFHGRTITIVGFSTDPTARAGFGPFAPGFKVIPFGDAEALEAAITPEHRRLPGRADPGRGRRDHSAARLSARRCARSARAIASCSSSTKSRPGSGRTGKLLAEEHEGVEADLTLIGKALSGGFYPVSAVLSNSEVLGVLKPGEHGSTFGGNPLACAVARTALKVLVEEGMIENAAAQGEYTLARLQAMRWPAVREVRGRGLMIGVELHPEAGGARRYARRWWQRGVLCKDTHDAHDPLLAAAGDRRATKSTGRWSSSTR